MVRDERAMTVVRRRGGFYDTSRSGAGTRLFLDQPHILSAFPRTASDSAPNVFKRPCMNMSYSKKRSRDDMDDSDDEPSLGRQILPVAHLPDNFDAVPLDGLQYLFTVRWVHCSSQLP